MHDIVMWYYIVNAWMHCVYMAMGIDTLIEIAGGKGLGYGSVVIP
jgi:hypothetical protein